MFSSDWLLRSPFLFISDYFFFFFSHNKGIACEKNDELVFYYTKRAAELGLVEA